MKELEHHRGGLHTLRGSTRLAYTLFLVYSLIGYAVMGILIATRTGTGSAELVTYYAGDGGLAYPKTDQELLEVTHFHLFSMPLLLFVQGHLFLLTSWRPAFKVPIVLAAFLGAALDLAAPWLILKVSPDLAFTKNVARVLLAIPLLIFAIVPLHEMWFRPWRRPPRTGSR